MASTPSSSPTEPGSWREETSYGLKETEGFPNWWDEHQPTLLDHKNLIENSPSRIACFSYRIDIPVSFSTQEKAALMWETDSYCVEANKPFVKAYGLRSRLAATGKPFTFFFPEANRQFDFERIFSESAKSQPDQEIVEVGTDGQERVLHMRVYPSIEDSFIKKIWVVLRDVTDHRRAGERLLRCEKHHRAIIERPGLVFVRILPSGAYEYLSPHVVDMVGYSAQDFMTTPGLFRSLLHPDDIEKHERIYIARKTLSKEIIEVEYRIKHSDGTYHWFMERQTPKLNELGEIEYFDSLALDINENKQLQANLTHAERMNAVGALAAGIAHDFNNHLTAILGQLGMCLSQISPSHPFYARLSSVEQAALCCSDMTKQLLTLGRKSDSIMQPLHLGSLLDDTVKLLSHLLPSTIEVSVRVGDRLPAVSGNLAQLQQVIVNLSVNARDAMPNGGTLQFEVIEKNLSPQRAKRIYPHAGPGKYVEVSVIDTGHGISETNLKKIFDPFFTTKEPGHGYGLGLTMVYSIVRAHGGWLKVSSIESKGSTFQFIIPIVESSAYDIVTPETLLRLGGNETILVAEDEEMVLSMVTSALALHGYKVLSAPDGEEALKIFLEQQDQIKLAFIDYTMPKLSGRQLIGEIRKWVPNLPIILTSGYSQQEIKELGGEGNTAFIDKPYPLQQLLKMIREIVER